MGPCMCGDLCCRSCGPAQGNTRCPVCGVWASDGGCENPERCESVADEWDSEDWLASRQDELERSMKEDA